MKINQIETFKVRIFQENHSHLFIVTAGHNQHIPTIFVEDSQIDEIYKTIYKTDVVDQTVRVITTGAVNQDSALLEVII